MSQIEVSHRRFDGVLEQLSSKPIDILEEEPNEALYAGWETVTRTAIAYPPLENVDSWNPERFIPIGTVCGELPQHVYETLAERLNSPKPEDILVREVKNGKFETILLGVCGQDLASAPFVLVESWPYFGDTVYHSHQALRLAADRQKALDIRPVVAEPFVDWTSQDGAIRYAVMEYVHMQELNLLMNDQGIPRLIFYGTPDAEGTQAVNDAIMHLPQEDAVRLWAYELTKILITRSMTTLLTAKPKRNRHGKEYVEVLVPKDFLIGAGDVVGRFEENGSLAARIVTFRGGAEPIQSSYSMLPSLLDYTEVFYDAWHFNNRHAITTGYAKLFPKDDSDEYSRDSWRFAENIIAWCCRELYCIAESAGQAVFARAMAMFYEDGFDNFGNALDPGITTNPYSIENQDVLREAIAQMMVQNRTIMTQ